MAKKILIIEDDGENLKLFNSILKINGYETLEAKSGIEGVRLAMAENPNLILVDLHISDMNGFEILKIIKSEPSTNHIPIISLSAYAFKGIRGRPYELSFDDCIVKPIILKEFIRVIERHL
jgi:CheY-like chemotaxis protein